MKKSKLALVLFLTFISGIASADPVESIFKILDVITTPVGTNDQPPKPSNQTPSAPPINMATPIPEDESTTKTQLLIPKDKKTKTAIDEALPNIKKILSIHSCLKDWEGVRLLNQYALPGVNLMPRAYDSFTPPINIMQYHNKNKCVGIRSIDQFTMPALNALQYRVVYFAEDSGETMNYQFLMQKSEDGNWLLTDKSHRTYY